MIHPHPRQEVNLNGWGQNSFKSVGFALWGAIPPVVVHGNRWFVVLVNWLEASKQGKLLCRPMQLREGGS